MLRGTFVPTLRLEATFLTNLVAILGTTISPYLFFWQASQEVEEEISMGRRTLRARHGATPRELAYAGADDKQLQASKNIEEAFKKSGVKGSFTHLIAPGLEHKFPPEWQNQTVNLKFGAVNYVADVWLNGHYLGYHEGGSTPFAFDATDVIVPGDVNAVRRDELTVNQWCRLPIANFFSRAFFTVIGHAGQVMPETFRVTTCGEAQAGPTHASATITAARALLIFFMTTPPRIES